MADKEDREILTTKNTKVSELLEMSKEMKSKCSDFVISKANSSNVRLNDLAGLSYIDAFGETHHSPMTRFSLSQLSTKIGVPTRYIEKCVESGRLDLAQINVNSWLDTYNKDLFVREYDNSVRGILSTKYSVCDTDEIMDIIGDRLDYDLYSLKGYFMTPERLHLRLVQKEKLNIPNEDLFAGIIVDSSDVGRSTLQVRFIVYKQVCTNGLIVNRGSNELFSQKHIGISSEEFAKGFSCSLDLVPSLISSVEDMIIKTKSEKGIKFNRLSQEELDKLVERIRIDTKLSDDGAKKVISIMQSNKYENNRWGYINALTEVAQDLTLERRLELEQYAGTLLVA